ncbi:hypothetical protein cyc_08427 [Cyclospora cayetanensis]|uniref:Uncharacterized protein n=1 Tax=Cyclospora cayetanensis TaxID=88456 RepID=A0A1D3DA76_9EIME|nr:hypothetical protein cyc_08427 [Cyclospora cayetanensis]
MPSDMADCTEPSKAVWGSGDPFRGRHPVKEERPSTGDTHRVSLSTAFSTSAEPEGSPCAAPSVRPKPELLLAAPSSADSTPPASALAAAHASAPPQQQHSLPPPENGANPLVGSLQSMRLLHEVQEVPGPHGAYARHLMGFLQRRWLTGARAHLPAGSSASPWRLDARAGRGFLAEAGGSLGIGRWFEERENRGRRGAPVAGAAMASAAPSPQARGSGAAEDADSAESQARREERAKASAASLIRLASFEECSSIRKGAQRLKGPVEGTAPLPPGTTPRGRPCCSGIIGSGLSRGNEGPYSTPFAVLRSLSCPGRLRNAARAAVAAYTGKKHPHGEEGRKSVFLHTSTAEAPHPRRRLPLARLLRKKLWTLGSLPDHAMVVTRPSQVGRLSSCFFPPLPSDSSSNGSRGDHTTRHLKPETTGIKVLSRAISLLKRGKGGERPFFPPFPLLP